MVDYFEAQALFLAGERIAICFDGYQVEAESVEDIANSEGLAEFALI